MTQLNLTGESRLQKEAPTPIAVAPGAVQESRLQQQNTSNISMIMKDPKVENSLD